MDRDGDGRINLTEFCSAMSLIRQAKQESLQQSLPSSGVRINMYSVCVCVCVCVCVYVRV